MIRIGRDLLAGLIVASALLLAGCGRGGDSAGEAAGSVTADGTALFRYNREYIFLAPGGESSVVAPFTFRSTDDGSELRRSAHAWLARGGTWDRFLDVDATTSRAGGVWRVVPHGDLRVIAGGPAEIETLRFESGERRLRLDLESPLTGWIEGGETRFRLLSGVLSIGPESISGVIFEVLRVEQTLDDGWPPGEDFDALYLTSGDSLQLVIADAAGASSAEVSHGWLKTPTTERALPGAAIRWTEVRPLQDARRDIPRRWSFSVPGSTMRGELEAVGFDALLGPERAGRRAVEIRFTVEGWVTVDEQELPVRGMLRHTQP